MASRLVFSTTASLRPPSRTASPLPRARLAVVETPRRAQRSRLAPGSTGPPTGQRRPPSTRPPRGRSLCAMKRLLLVALLASCAPAADPQPPPSDDDAGTAAPAYEPIEGGEFDVGG